jgi:anti-sigma regulatory factor (Ser/Thr protein kinase)
VKENWSLPATPAAVGEMRRAVGTFAADAGVCEPPLADVRLAVTEAVSNVVVHSYRTDAEPGPVEVGADYSAHELRIVVSDRGMGCAPRPDSPGLGMGLPLIAAIADGFEVRRRAPRGTELHMCFTL